VDSRRRLYARHRGATPTYNGENLAQKGVVVRDHQLIGLGIFGFLAHPELTKESDVHSSGNYGLLDMVAAFAMGAEKHLASVRRRSQAA